MLVNVEHAYKGREHSWVKHRLLEHYLATALSIIGVAGKRSAITYVDCFAGPWGDTSEDLSGTSIAISLRIIDKVRKDMARRPSLEPIRFQAIYIEKDRARFQRLKSFLSSHAPQDIECHALEGDYFDQQDELLRLCGNSFSFFFVDPKGWRDVGIDRLSKLLKRKHSEFLINFMYDFINRAVGMAGVREQVEEVIGTLVDEDLTTLESLEPGNRSEEIVQRYRLLLKARMTLPQSARPRSYHAEILNPAKERLHYQLVYLTRHPKGIVKFAESSEKADFLQALVRTKARHESTTQNSLFSVQDEVEHRQAARVDIEDVGRYLLGHFTSEARKFDETLLADMLEETGWFIRDLEVALTELIAAGKLRNLDATKPRSKHPVHFEKGGERIVRLD